MKDSHLRDLEEELARYEDAANLLKLSSSSPHRARERELRLQIREYLEVMRN
jgi:hypothetical protein